MGKVIAKKIRGMSWSARISLITICTLLMSVFMYEGWLKPGAGEATPTASQGWSSLYGGTAFPAVGGYTYAITPAANTNRMLVVAVSSTLTGAATQTCTVTYGGKSLTQVVGDGTTSAQQHSYLFYLNDANIQVASGSTLIATVTGGTSAYNHVFAAVYTGVDQSGSPITNSRNYNSGTSSSTIGPFATALTIGSGDQAVEVVNLTRTGSSSARTVQTWATNWAQTFTASGSNGSSYGVSTTIGSDSTAGTSTSQHTASGSAQCAMSAMSIKSGPTLTTAAPTGGNPGQTLDVGLTGTNFVAGSTANFGAGITVNSTTYNSATSLTANITITAGAAYGFRTVTVTGTSGVATGSNLFQVTNPNGPTVSTISPAALGQGATNIPVTITGTNFQSGATVSLSGTGVTVNSTTFNSATSLTAYLTVTTSAATGARDLTVTNPDTSSITKLGALTVSARPTVTSLSPANGHPGDSNKSVTITGTGFVAGTPLAASISGTGITVNSTSYVSATQLTANINIDAAATTGARTVTVVNGDNGVSAAGGSFNVVTAPAPSISSLSTSTLSSYASSFTITINGSNFLNSPAPTVSCTGVTFGTVTYLDANTLKVVVNSNSNSSGSGTLTVTNNDSQTATTTLNFSNSRPGSSLTAAPVKGSTGQTMNVVLTGTGFTSGATASFSGSGITVNSTTYNSATQLTANITIASNATAGASSVTVVNGDGGTRGAVSNVFTVTPVGVTSVTPSFGPGGGGTVTIAGQGFATGATVAIGGGVTVNSVQFVKASTLTANVSVAAGALAGAYDVTVTVGANSGTGTGAFTINAPPAIASLAPASLRQGDTGTVTINGSGFVSGCTLQFNGTGVTLNSVSYISPSQLSANLSLDPNAVLGSQALTVVNPDGGTTTGGAFATTVTAKTIPGAITYTNVTNNSITVVANYSGDGDGDGSCTVSYGLTPACELGTVTAMKGSGAYTATFNNLLSGNAGAGKLYYFSVAFADPDGVLGASQLSGSQPTKGNALLHNSQNTFSSKWSQGWGIEGGKYGAFNCTTCHNESTANIKMVAGTIQSPSMENWSSSGSNALAVRYLNPSTDLGNDSAHATSTNACEVCHTRTNHNRYNNAAANHQGTSDCTVCHDHNEGFLPGCQNCHSTPQGPNGYRRKIVGNGGDFFGNMSTHGKFSPLSSKTCTVCHDGTTHQSFSDGVSVGLKNADTGATVVYDGTSATAPAVKDVCLSCHDADGATVLGVNASSPFGSSQDFRAPTNISQYWPASNGAHATKMYCFNCHGNSKGVDGSTSNPRYNGHASGTKHVLQDQAYNVIDPTNYCFNCHKSTSTDPNMSFKNISGQYGLANKHVTAKCFDCHGDESNSLDSVHSLQAGSQTPASGVIAKNLANATGRSMVWSGLWLGAASSTSVPSNQVTAEYQVCFKCHAANGSGTTPDVNNSSYTNAGALTNLALEFNPNNGSAHPVVVSLNNQTGSVGTKAVPVARMAAPWTNVGTQLMTCSDCHATNSTGAKGPHGSSIKWMLAGVNQAWPYTLASYNGTSTGGTLRVLSSYNTGQGTKDGLFCLNCHTVRPASGGNGWHSASGLASGQHSSNATIPACATCHIRVPHGGKISRLLQTTNTPARYRTSGTSSTTPSFTRWGTSTVNVKGTSMSSSYFGSSCSEHSGGASGGEAW